MRKVISIYSIFLGVSILILWTILYLSDNIPELKDSPLAICFHIAAEASMALMSISSGVLVYMKKNMGYPLFLVSSGTVIYSVVNSSGYYAELGNLPMVYMFAAILVLQCLLASYTIARISIKNAP